MLNLQNIDDAKRKVRQNSVNQFVNVDESYRCFLKEIEVKNFRHLKNLKISFEHPVTVLTGTNKIGKTSLLLLIACSHEKFIRIDSTTTTTEFREHTWKDVLSFTKYEGMTDDYIYQLKWRVGFNDREGEGKRLANKQSWGGLGKKSSDRSRINAKIRDREVRFIDLERILPARSFSNSLLRKIEISSLRRVNEDVEKAFCYIMDLETVEIYEIGSHINKICYLVKYVGHEYSSYNTASGEDALITVLRDVIDSPTDSLILIDEAEAGLHPYIQRKLADILHFISWKDKKQFILTTHSPTFLSSFDQASRRFIDKKSNGDFQVIKKISKHAAFSKMDSEAYPLIHLYCEDNLASYIVKQLLIELNNKHKNIDKLVNIIKSGPSNEVKNDYERHKKNYMQMRLKIGYGAVFDGDCKHSDEFSVYFKNSSEHVFFLFPFESPEVFLIKAFLKTNNNSRLKAALMHTDHHALFEEMVEIGLSSDVLDARNRCWTEFVKTAEFRKLLFDFSDYIITVLKDFSIRFD